MSRLWGNATGNVFGATVINLIPIPTNSESSQRLLQRSYALAIPLRAIADVLISRADCLEISRNIVRLRLLSISRTCISLSVGSCVRKTAW